MRTKVKYNSRFFNEFKRILIEHINSNLKDYIALSIIFIMGVMIGVMIINHSNEQSKTEIQGYINEFINTIHNKEFTIDKLKLAKISMLENIKTMGLIWIAGSTVIGIPLIYIITCYKGFCIGYTISAIISSLGIGKRNRLFICIIIFAKHYSGSYCANAECKCIKII